MTGNASVSEGEAVGPSPRTVSQPQRYEITGYSMTDKEEIEGIPSQPVSESVPLSAREAQPSGAFTPGPWEIGERAFSYIHVEFDRGGSYFTIVNEDRDCPVAFAPADDDDQDAANARLIAAAPDLLAHLRFAVKLLSALPGIGATAQVEAMCAAIGKATGAQP